MAGTSKENAPTTTFPFEGQQPHFRVWFDDEKKVALSICAIN